MSNAASMALSGLVGIAFGCVLLWFVVYPLLGARPKWWRRAERALASTDTGETPNVR